MQHPECQKWIESGGNILAGGPGTFSKHWSRYPISIAPACLTHGEGAFVFCPDNHRYLDTVSALGANLLGYNHPVVTQAIIEQLHRGTSFSMLHPLEVEVAEQLVALVPCAEMVRWARNGTDVTNMAVRLARAVTGHAHVVFVGYAGGGMDSYGITTDKPAGILPQLAQYNHQIPWGGLSGIPRETYLRVEGDVAAVLVEVPPRPWGESVATVSTMLQMYQQFAHGHGGLFILDEIVTFPRYGLHGAQAVYGVIPDLCCVSKALANGLPLAALVGQARYMERLNTGDIFASSTFSGETTALAAAHATLEVLETTEALANLWRHGQRLGDGLRDLFTRHRLPAALWGTPARLQVRWTDVPDLPHPDELRTFWLAEHAKRGILHGIGVQFPQCCWTDMETDLLLRVAEEVCREMQAALQSSVLPFRERLECPVIRDVLGVR
jgi:glutamate-1-semialdehyde 2,1-aminomutase